MALFKVILLLFKRIGKLFGGGKKGGDPTKDPDEKRIAIYGPSAVGKTVFFAMLAREAEGDPVFDLSPADEAGKTARVINKNRQTLESGEWLAGSVETTEMNFRVNSKRLSGRKKGFPFNTQDYRGETIEEDSEEVVRLLDWMSGADAIMFVVSPDLMEDPARCRLAVDRFKGLINQVKARTGGVLRAPIGVMVTKSDLLDGFNARRQVQLFHRKSEFLKAKDFDEMVEGVLEQVHLKDDLVFARSVRQVMESLKSLFVFLSNVTLEYQVFFVSAVGRVRVEADAGGQQVTRPPSPLTPLGVIEPFWWVIETLRRKEQIARVNGIRSVIALLSVLVFLFFAIPYAMHLLPKWTPVREAVGLAAADSDEVLVERTAGYAGSIGVSAVSVMSLPGTRATETKDLAAKLAASYAAYDFLKRKIQTARGEELETLTEEWERETEAPADLHPKAQEFWNRLPPNASNKIRDALVARIDVFNHELLAEARSLTRNNDCEAIGGLAEKVLDWGGALLDKRNEWDALRSEIETMQQTCATTAGCSEVVGELVRLSGDLAQQARSRTLTEATASMDQELEKIEGRLEQSCSGSGDNETVLAAQSFVSDTRVILQRAQGLNEELGAGDAERCRDIRRGFSNLKTRARAFRATGFDAGVEAMEALEDYLDSRMAEAARCQRGGIRERDLEIQTELEGLFDTSKHRLFDVSWLQSRVSDHSRLSAITQAVQNWRERFNEEGVRVDLRSTSEEVFVLWEEPKDGIWGDDTVGPGITLPTRWYPDYEYRVRPVDSDKNDMGTIQVIDVSSLLAGSFSRGVGSGYSVELEFSGDLNTAFEDLEDAIRAVFVQ